MLSNIKEDSVLFLDIETVPQFPNYNILSEKIKKLWDKKAKRLSRNNESSEELYERAGIYAEFGKIICISVGIIANYKNERYFRVKSFFGDFEKDILIDFNQMLRKNFKKKEFLLCAHNGKEFDFPYLARRNLLNGLKIPKMLNTAGKKPWEINHLDTLELWKFGDYKHWTSLDLLTTIFKIPTPKDDIDGSMVCEVYWKDKDLERIVKYCEKDVLAVAQLFLRYKGEKLIKEKNVKYIG